MDYHSWFPIRRRDLVVMLKLVEIGTNESHAVVGEDFVVGRSSDADLTVADGGCSRRQFRIVLDGGAYFVEGLSSRVPTYCADQPVEVRCRLSDGVLIRAGQSSFQIVLTDSQPALEPISIVDKVIIGRDADCDVCLAHVQVSKKHARIFQRRDQAYIQDLGSANGTFVDGELVTSPRPLGLNSVLRIGPYSLTYLGDRMLPVTATKNAQLEGHGLTRQVPDSDNPTELKTILDNVSLVVRPREFICLLGPSGSGKSTLLSALSARTPANQGEVLINGTNLYKNFESLKSEMALVPQRDILHDSLSVEDALRYTARLRLPVDSSAEEIERQIDDVLTSVGLEANRTNPIRQLSGGQQRRASLANELISNPSLLFLDEVTSGLDEETDREMMQLFRRLADSGMTIVCVTHSLVNVTETCHLVAFLTVGGKLAYVGSPREALEDLNIDRLGAMYKRLEDASQFDQLQSENLRSDSYKRYVLDRQTKFVTAQSSENVVGETHYWHHLHRTVMHQLPLLMRRYGSVFVADKNALRGLLMQCLVVAVVLFLVFGNVGDETNSFRRTMLSCNVLFVLSVSGFWFGCNNTVKEIVKERGIYTKELQANLDPASFYLSKFLLQSGVLIVQVLLLLVLVKWWCGLPGNLVAQARILVMGGAAGVAVGLCISSVVLTEEAALALVPLVLIPQIILSDVFVELEGSSKVLGSLFASNYWIYGAMRGTLPDELQYYLFSPLAPPISRHLATVAIGVHVAILATVAVFVLHIRDRAMASTNKSFTEAVRGILFFRAILNLFRRS
jgi:ABC-type multidrug transport system ATPase subunit/pSer/pThr/pTyr-binding forkhead associated (FHA) protein